MDTMAVADNSGWTKSAHVMPNEYGIPIFGYITKDVILVRGEDGKIYLSRPEGLFSQEQNTSFIKWLDERNPEAKIGVIPAGMDIAEIILGIETDRVKKSVQHNTTALTQSLHFRGYTRAYNYSQLLAHYGLQNPEDVETLISSFSIEILGRKSSTIIVGPDNYDIALYLYHISGGRATFSVGESYYDTWAYFRDDAVDAFENQNTKHQIIRDILFEEGNARVTITGP